MAGKLKALQVKNLKTPGRYSDGTAGLQFFVQKSGSRSWVQRIMVEGVRRDIGLGKYPTVSLAEARNLALHNQRTVRDGGSIAKGRTSVAVAATMPTLRELAGEVAGLKRWKNEKSARDWSSWLDRYVFPTLDKPVDQITRNDVLDVVIPLWTNKPPTGKKVRQIIKDLLGFALAKELITVNHAGEAIDPILTPAARTQRHHPALPYDRVGDALKMVEAGQSWGTTKLGFRWLVLTAARTKEVRYAAWGEINWDNRVWTIPGDKMKSGRQHRVPLSDACMDVLTAVLALPINHEGLIFPNVLNGQALSDKTFLLMLDTLEIPAVPHGFRSSFRDWASEQTSYPWAVCEAALAHVSGDQAARAYARSDLLERRRELMQEWADYVAA